MSGKLKYILWLTLVVAILLEVLLRVYFSFQVGPRVFAYGLPSYRNEFGDLRQEKLIEVYGEETEVWDKDEATLNTVYTHESEQSGYLKFFSNEKKFHKDVDTGEAFPITINSHGFRGEEFSFAKSEGTIRVLTLGASSTVGLWNRDHQTYPVKLQAKLNELCGNNGRRFEVINFAIPHAISDQILAMFIAEGLALDPDIITFYEGRNDSYQLHPMEFRGGDANYWEQDNQPQTLERITESLNNRLLLAKLIDELITNNARVEAEKTLEILDRVASRTSREFIRDLDTIRKIADDRNIEFIVISQQANSKSWYGLPEKERLKSKGVTYQDEVDQILSVLNAGESISGYEFNFLIHDRLMRDLETWAEEKELPYIDFIEILDKKRHLLVSWVHLHPEANKLLADAIADKIYKSSCVVDLALNK